MDTSKKPRLSAVCPTYNRVVFLPDMINSVLEQTFKDWELIVYDDGSTDTTPELMEYYTKKDSRIKYFRRKKNMGIATTRNDACEKAQGDIIVICDSDDVQMPNRFAVIDKFFKTKRDTDIFYHRMFMCNLVMNIVGQIGADSFDMEKMLEKQTIPQPTLSFKKLVWEKVKYNPKAKYGEDWEWLINCGLADFKFRCNNKILVKYREHAEGSRLEKADFVKKYDEKMIKEKRKEWEKRKKS